MTEEQSVTRWWDDVEQDAIHQTAAEWLLRLQDPNLSLEDALAWQRWVGADARHATAFARIEGTYRQLGDMRATASDPPLAGMTREREATSAEYDGSIPVTQWLAAKEKVHPSRLVPRWRFAAIAAAVVCLAVALAWAISGGAHTIGVVQRHSAPVIARTAIGENRSSSLPDGSMITLGGGTEVRVDFDAKARRVELVRGEAFFVVAKDSLRPFTVRAADTTVTAIGTQFNVRRRTDSVKVAVLEGRVRVAPAPSFVPAAWLREFRPALAPVQLDAGQQTLAGSAAIEAATPLPDPSAAMGWQTGQLEFDRELLRDVLEDVNRYSSKRIVLGDDDLGDLRITGTVLGSDVRGWVSSLERVFAVEALEEPDRIVIRSKLGS
jgi:transmembrane sensor